MPWPTPSSARPAPEVGRGIEGAYGPHVDLDLRHLTAALVARHARTCIVWPGNFAMVHARFVTARGGWRWPARPVRRPCGHSFNGAAFASRLPNGDTLITDSLNNRILEVTATKRVDFVYVTNRRPDSVANPNPTRAVRLRDGTTLISDQFNDQVISITPDKAIVFRQGMIGVAGTGFDQLNAPYDAKVVGDYTGLTPP